MRSLAFDAANRTSYDHAVIEMDASCRASFRNVMQCGSVWACPVCASKISERRKLELEEACRTWEARGNTYVLITLTQAHGRGDDLKAQLDAMTSAMRKMHASRAFRQLRARYDWAGHVRALEVTWGQANGWHPHQHMLWFLERGDLSEIEMLSLECELFTLWKKHAVEAGLSAPSEERGTDVRKYVKKSYLGKGGGCWTEAAELTKAVVKRGKVGRFTPKQLLVSHAEGNAHHGALFVEYVAAFHRKHQLQWTPGLKKLLDIKEKTDEELLKEKQECPIVDSIKIHWRAWLDVVQLNAQAHLLAWMEAAAMIGIGLRVAWGAWYARKTYLENLSRWGPHVPSSFDRLAVVLAIAEKKGDEDVAIFEAGCVRALSGVVGLVDGGGASNGR